MTPEQQAILTRAARAQGQGADPDASAFVSAHAGSGKTRVLVDRVARLLLRDAPPARILCLTFTKVAAAEMQDRLYQRLGGWAIAPDGRLRDELAALSGAAPANLDLARRLFARALDTPGGLNVQTIHSFCERLLRQFPIEAGLQPGFVVLQGAEGMELTRMARRDVALDAARDPHGALAQAFDRIAAHGGEADLLDFALMRRQALSDLFARGDGLAGALRALRARLSLGPDDTLESLTAQAAAQTPKARLHAAAAAMDAGSPTDQERAARLRAALEIEEPAAFWDAYLAVVRTRKGERLARGLATRKVCGAAPDIAVLFGETDAAGEECARIDAARARMNAARCADLSAAGLTVAHAFIAAGDARKARRRALDFSDLIHRARALLQDSEARDWVRYKLDGGVDHILVDEAQDNSAEQWEIVDAAALEFFAGGDPARAPRTLFAVGDEKQSIFSFQGADPALFRGKARDYAARAHGAGLTFIAPELEVSFRSAPLILRAADATFDTPDSLARMFALTGEETADARLFQEEWTPHAAFRDAALMGGTVELWPPLPAARTMEDDDPAAPVDAPSAGDPKTALARMIAARIRAMIEAGTGVLDPDGGVRPMRAGDALILVRKRDRFFGEMIRQLKLAGLPVAGADRMRLTDQTAVKDLLALARFALLPEDDLSLAEVLKSPFLHPVGADAPITEEALFDLAWAEGGRRRPLWRVLEETDDPRFDEARALLREVLAGVGVAPPYEVFSRFLNRMTPEGVSIARRMYGRLGPEAEDPTEEFLARALAHQRRGAPSLQRFVAEIEAEAEDVKREMESARDEVRVMTVHGAKGLEAPLVFLPDTTSAGGDKGGLLADDDCGLIWSPGQDDDPPAAARLRQARKARGDAESLRLLYVAMTRARDHLVVCGWRFGGRSGKNPLGRIDEGCWWEMAASGLRRAGAREQAFPGEEDDTPMLVLGAPVTAAGEAPPSAIPVPIPDWTRAAAPQDRAPRRAAPSRLADRSEDGAGNGGGDAASSPLGDDRARRFGRGTLIHKLLELLPPLPEAAREAAARAFLSRRPALDEAARADVLAAAMGVLSHPDFRDVFAPHGRAEAPIVGALPDGTAINGTVDRLLVTAEEALIIDYKTNRPPPATVEAADPAYIAQMAAYRAVLAQVFPGRRVRCALLWTDAPMLMEIPAAALDARLPGTGAA